MKTIPSTLVFFGFARSISIQDRDGESRKVHTFKNHLLTASVDGKTIYLVPNTASKRIPNVASGIVDKGKKLYRKWSGGKESTSLGVQVKSGKPKMIGYCEDVYYTSDKFKTLGKFSDYIHDFKKMPCVYKSGDTYKLYPVRVTARGIEDSSLGLKSKKAKNPKSGPPHMAADITRKPRTAPNLDREYVVRWGNAGWSRYENDKHFRDYASALDFHASLFADLDEKIEESGHESGSIWSPESSWVGVKNASINDGIAIILEPYEDPGSRTSKTYRPDLSAPRSQGVLTGMKRKKKKVVDIVFKNDGTRKIFLPVSNKGKQFLCRYYGEDLPRYGIDNSRGAGNDYVIFLERKGLTVLEDKNDERFKP